MLSINPITIIATRRRIISELARLVSFGWLHAKITRAHRVDELPDSPADIAPQLLPPHVINHRGVATDVRAVAEHLSIQALIQSLSLTTQTVIPTARQFETRQKQLL